ncbi:peptidase M48 Ste24p [Anaeromyxobacter sp. K]|uniref:M48 family metallopeptidase n=1 Tax=Anaeromyxobacter sp. (strain K) TaxID=447217 RepID=UPI00015F9D74|nr:M48 family metallopeptidase [Anaeromyxobacter sp. K]ACG71464.1 peptidase M48 Ste24p [Anaeromyxobacter sp. K]
MHRPSRTPLAALAVLALAAACTGKQRVATETRLASVLIPTEQEKQLGLQVKEQLETKEHVQYLEDPAVNAYVQGVTGKILASAKKDRPDVDWSVKVINDPKTVNAFATPGGFLYVYSGLLLAADDTAEVAGVLGHEAGHVVARHSARQMVNAMGLETVMGIALGKNPNGAAQLAAGLAGKGALLAYGRADESEADEYGARYAAAAGYDPHGIATFFQKLEKGEGKQPGWTTYLSTHPATPDRIEKVDRYIAEHHLTGTGGRGGAELAKVKERLKAIPPPPAPPAQGAGR